MKRVIKKKKDFIPCTRKSNGEVIIMIDYQPINDTMGWCLTNTFKNNPSLNEMKTYVNNYYNNITSAKILSGLTYDDKIVWLSETNQSNYKSFYDFAKQSGGKNLPVKIKLGDTNDYTYVTFNTVDELEDFYALVYNHIQKCIVEGWDKKDSIDWSLYQ